MCQNGGTCCRAGDGCYYEVLGLDPFPMTVINPYGGRRRDEETVEEREKRLELENQQQEDYAKEAYRDYPELKRKLVEHIRQIKELQHRPESIHHPKV